MANNVYICQFSLDRVQQYEIQASIKDSGFEYQDIKDILKIGASKNGDEILEKKRKHHPFALALCNANHFFEQNRVVPDKLWVQNKNSKLPFKQDYIFSIWDGGILFNQSCVNILKQHRLGENILTPVQIYDLSTGELVSDEVFYFLNLYERRTYICNPQSDSMFVYIQGAQKYSTRGVPINNGILEVDKSVLDCDVDLWYDPRILGHFFISESLYQSLNQAGMIDKFDPHTCKLV